MVLRWDELVDDQDHHDGDVLCDWEFSQKSFVTEQVKFDKVKKEIMHDVSNQKNRACNQSSSDIRDHCSKLCDLLLDDQSTCDVIINSKLLSNTRKCKWTLRLQTQAGDYIIHQVGEMKGVGLAWFYPDGVANILSQFRMAAHSKWRMKFDADEHHKSGEIEDLSYDMTTGDGFNCNFTSTSKGLHVCSIKDRRKDGIFGTKVTNNVNILGSTCHALIENEGEPEGYLADDANLSGVSDSSDN